MYQPSKYPHRVPKPRTIEGRLVPKLDANWSEPFIKELRFLGVPGAEIAEALSDVNTHVTESGDDPWRSFGEPITYASSLNLPQPTRQRKVFWEPACLAFQGVAMWIFLESLWRAIHFVEVFPIQPPLIFLVLSLVILMSFSKPVMRMILHTPHGLFKAILAPLGMVGVVFFVLWITGSTGGGLVSLLWAWIIAGGFMVLGTVPLIVSGLW